MQQRPPDTRVTRSLNASLGGAVGAIASVSVVAGAVTLLTLGELRHAIAERDRSAVIARTLYEVQVAMLDQETGLRGYFLSGDVQSLAPYDHGRAAFGRADAALHAALAPGSEEAARVAEADEAARAWQMHVGEPGRRVTADPATRAEAVRIETSGEGRHRFDQLRAALGAAADAASRRRLLWDGRLVEAAHRVGLAVGLGIAVTLAICAAVSLAIRRVVSRPLLALAGAMGRLAAHDLEVPVPATADRSEVGAMARAVAVFKQGLVELDRTSVLRATADTLPALVGYVDAARRIRFLNDEFARAFGLGADAVALTGLALAQAFGREPFPGLPEGELDAAFAGQERRFEHVMQQRDGAGATRVFEAVFRPHQGDSGVMLGVVTLLNDITERKRLLGRLAAQAADLTRSNEELEQFAYVASHDLKAPLRGIENLVTWIEEDLGALVEGGVRTNMDLLRTRVRRLEALLDDLLAYSRAGRADAADETVDTAALVGELASLLSPPPGIRIEAGAGLPTLRCARAPLAQVLHNLIGNAIKHNDRSGAGRVLVRAARADGATIFTVEDDGPGIAPQFRERVFGMFQTLRPRDEVEGSGMGLAIVRKIVEQRRGRIWLAEGTLEPSGTGSGPRGLAVHFTWPDTAVVDVMASGAASE